MQTPPSNGRPVNVEIGRSHCGHGRSLPIRVGARSFDDVLELLRDQVELVEADSVRRTVNELAFALKVNGCSASAVREGWT